MARVFDLDLRRARITNKDFAGNKFGPDNRQFSVVIEDPELIKKLIADGVHVWVAPSENPDEPPRGYVTVKVSYRFGSPDIALISPEGNAFCFTEQNVDTLDSAWFKDIDMHIHGSSYERMNRSGVTVYLDTFVARQLSAEEREEIARENLNRTNPIREEYKSIFGG